MMVTFASLFAGIYSIKDVFSIGWSTRVPSAQIVGKILLRKINDLY